MDLTKKLSDILRLTLAPDFTSVSYAISVGGEIIAADAIGVNGGKEGKASTVTDTYNVASVSKIYCALAVMKACELGLCDLDTPVVNYLPRFRMPDERYKKITLRHCLNHACALPGTMWKGFSATDVTRDDYYEHVYDYFAHSMLKAEPGEYSVYCNDGFTLAEMVVAAVAGMRYSEFLKKYIWDPIGASTTRTSDQITGEYVLTKEKKKPAELLFIQGGAGITTSMIDLCKMGNMILHPEGYFLPSSIEEMAKPQGVGFLEGDDRSKNYGLGWDTVHFTYDGYDVGDDAVQKGGNSFQFTTQFVVIPKYDAVIAISETHDCRIDVAETAMRLFATAMLERGVDIATGMKPVPEGYAEKYSGTYLVPSGPQKVTIYGHFMHINNDSPRGKKQAIHKALRFNGEYFEAPDGQQFWFEEHNGECYLITRRLGLRNPMAQKARDFAPISKAWEERLGKKYVCISTIPEDMVIYELMTGFELMRMPGKEGIMFASFSGRKDADIYGGMDCAVREIDENIATGFLHTPANPSRDLTTLHFEGDLCHAASYTYRDVSTLPVYKGQGFHQGKLNMVYKIEEPLEALPYIPTGRRIMILDTNLSVVYDTMYGGEFKVAKEGYISLV